MSTFNLSRMPPNGCSTPMLDVCPGPWAAQEEYHVLSPRWPCAIETSVEVVPRGISPTSLWCGESSPPRGEGELAEQERICGARHDVNDLAWAVCVLVEAETVQKKKEPSVNATSQSK